ncbi:hypothetical protein AEM42_13045 [Betaproteobacteria bacterium UKL13-2]|jgi:hypothetical protein|nr:hypothetical protein AEM42_13045 [Betaproteobacteria bacterium UKL13-2]HCG52062.1 hypothetical protein [Betaproteobacteria bacterium]
MFSLARLWRTGIYLAGGSWVIFAREAQAADRAATAMGTTTAIHATAIHATVPTLKMQRQVAESLEKTSFHQYNALQEGVQPAASSNGICV